MKGPSCSRIVEGLELVEGISRENVLVHREIRIASYARLLANTNKCVLGDSNGVGVLGRAGLSLHSVFLSIELVDAHRLRVNDVETLSSQQEERVRLGVVPTEGSQRRDVVGRRISEDFAVGLVELLLFRVADAPALDLLFEVDNAVCFDAVVEHAPDAAEGMNGFSDVLHPAISVGFGCRFPFPEGNVTLLNSSVLVFTIDCPGEATWLPR